jgi:cytochrome oxidase Cu insertion factor (SCO1/SenC/PrrC family)
MRMTSPAKPMAARILTALAVVGVIASLAVGPPTAGAVEVGDRAPDFTLPSTNGVDISLKDFRGKKWVFLEFYAAAFVPT